MIEKSKNGTWKREKLICLPVSTDQHNSTKSYAKIGTIKCEIEIIEKFQWLNIEKITNGDVSKSFIEIGMGKEVE